MQRDYRRPQTVAMTSQVIDTIALDAEHADIATRRHPERNEAESKDLGVRRAEICRSRLGMTRANAFSPSTKRSTTSCAARRSARLS